MIINITGNILRDNSQALVNPVNCVGVMGKGLALQFKRAYTENFRDYARQCGAGTLRPGTVHVWANPLPKGPRFIINLPTKDHWRDPSKVEYIHDGLHALAAALKENHITSVAVPPLGAGLGGLPWATVCPLIKAHMKPLQDVQTTIYHPLL